MHKQISPAVIECTLRLEWSEVLKTEIRSLCKSGLSYNEAKVILRGRLGITKDAFNAHLEGSHTINVINFLHGCHVLGITYVINSNGQCNFIASDSIFNNPRNAQTGISIVANRQANCN